LEDGEWEEEDYDDMSTFSGSASEGDDSGCNWAEKGTFSILDIENSLIGMT